MYYYTRNMKEGLFLDDQKTICNVYVHMYTVTLMSKYVQYEIWIAYHHNFSSAGPATKRRLR